MSDSPLTLQEIGNHLDLSREKDVLRAPKSSLKRRDKFCPQKGVEHVLDDIGDSLDVVAAWIGHWLYDGWGHSYTACHRQRYRTDPSHSGTKDNERHCSELGPLTC